MRLIVIAVLLTSPVAAAAQGAVGSGPLTGSLVDTEPTTNVLSIGPFKLAPGITIREIGRDDNVFDEATNPKTDFVAAGTPDVSAFTRTRFVQLSLYGGAELQYYKKYLSEQYVGYQARGRADILLSRLFPFVGAGRTKSRTRPNGEIDVRADQQQDEISGGVGFELSTHAKMFVSAAQLTMDFKDANNRGVSLDQSLGRDTTEYAAGVKTDITPLLALQGRASYREDKFRLDRTRNSNSRIATAELTFAPPAVVSGVASVSVQDFRPDDPKVHPYRGITGSGFLTFTILELARMNVGFNRSLEYSFDGAEGYFIQNGVTTAYTQRLHGAVDVQLLGVRTYFTYGQRDGMPPRTDRLESVNGSIGYNLRNRTRVALNYEYSRRRSPAREERNYNRRRAFLSWSFAY